MRKSRYFLVMLCSILLTPVTSIAASNTDSAKINLGRILYFDSNLSMNRNQSCASCHAPPGFVDPANTSDPVNSVVSLGSFPELNGGRNSPSAGYAAFTPVFNWDAVNNRYAGGQFWDGRADTLTDQAKGPFLNPVEMAMPDARAVLDRLIDGENINQTRYVHLFDRVYGIDLNNTTQLNNPAYVDTLYTMLADAIAEFEKSTTFTKFTSKYDHWLAGSTELSPTEQLGMQLFNGKAMCSSCHVSTVLSAADGSVIPPVFSDYSYANIGIPKSLNPLIADLPVDYGLGGRDDIAAIDPDGLQLGKFKVMSLRNIEITAPYGHNGYFATLEEMVNFLNTRDVANWYPPEVAQNLNTEQTGNLGLSAKEEAALVDFLKTLTDGYR